MYSTRECLKNDLNSITKIFCAYNSFMLYAMDSHDFFLFYSRSPPWILSVSRKQRRYHHHHHFFIIDQNLTASLKKHSTIKKMLEAAVRFRPTPPAFKDISRTCRSIQTFELSVPIKSVWSFNRNDSSTYYFRFGFIEIL